MLRALITVFYLVGAVFSVAGFYRPRRLISATVVTAVSWGLLTFYLIYLGMAAAELPVTGFGTWLAVLVWIIAGMALMAVWVFGGQYRALSGFLLPVGAVFWLADLGVADRVQRMPLSGWLPLHIVAATLAVVALLLAAIFGLMYTEKERELRKKSVEVFYYRLPALQEMDRWSSRLAGLGLGLWLVALAAGALSARQVARPPRDPLAAGWSLFTAVMYGFYFMMRSAFGWRGRPAAVMLMVLFLVVLINFLTLNLHWIVASSFHF